MNYIFGNWFLEFNSVFIISCGAYLIYEFYDFLKTWWPNHKPEKHELDRIEADKMKKKLIDKNESTKIAIISISLLLNMTLLAMINKNKEKIDNLSSTHIAFANPPCTEFKLFDGNMKLIFSSGCNVGMNARDHRFEMTNVWVYDNIDKKKRKYNLEAIFYDETQYIKDDN